MDLCAELEQHPAVLEKAVYEVCRLVVSFRGRYGSKEEGNDARRQLVPLEGTFEGAGR